jgi:hypothetical protein
MIGQYDEAIKLSTNGPPLHPLFDDVAAVRIARAPLRRVSPALKAADTARATANFGAFKNGWGNVQELYAARSQDVLQDTQAALDAADRALAAPSSETVAAVDRLLDRYNVGVNMLNAAARNADPNKARFGDEDVESAARVGVIERDVRASVRALDGNDRPGALLTARSAAGQRFDLAAPVLQPRNGADAAVKKALDAYVAALEQSADTGTAGGPAQATAARKAGQAAIDAVLVGQQAVAGQFWTDTNFHTAYAAALAAL